MCIVITRFCPLPHYTRFPSRFDVSSRYMYSKLTKWAKFHPVFKMFKSIHVPYFEIIRFFRILPFYYCGRSLISYTNLPSSSYHKFDLGYGLQKQVDLYILIYITLYIWRCKRFFFTKVWKQWAVLMTFTSNSLLKPTSIHFQYAWFVVFK